MQSAAGLIVKGAPEVQVTSAHKITGERVVRDAHRAVDIVNRPAFVRGVAGGRVTRERIVHEDHGAASVVNAATIIGDSATAGRVTRKRAVADSQITAAGVKNAATFVEGLE